MFQGTKTVARFNSTDTVSIDTLITFLQGYMDLPSHIVEKISNCPTEEDGNITDCSVGHSLVDEDYKGPVPTQLTEQFNWVLLFSWIFIFYMLFQKLKPINNNNPNPDEG